jgi:hypothetical protein
VRVSEYYQLGRTQPTLEFVDVDTWGDTRVYVDPRALRFIDSDWARECVTALQSFFTAVLEAIQSDDARAVELLGTLHEPNETRLGQSRDRAQGRGMGQDLAQEAWDALSTSQAVQTGLLEDLEDSILFVPGIGFDIVSDITTNIIRRQLIKFTHDACGYYDIPLVPDVSSGRLWDHRTKDWTQGYIELPVSDHGPLLLVPKSIVRRTTTFDPGEYYNHYVLPWRPQS